MITDEQARSLEKGTVYGVVTRYRDVWGNERVVTFRATFKGVGDYGELLLSMKPVSTSLGVPREWIVGIPERFPFGTRPTPPREIFNDATRE